MIRGHALSLFKAVSASLPPQTCVLAAAQEQLAKQNAAAKYQTAALNLQANLDMFATCLDKCYDANRVVASSFFQVCFCLCVCVCVFVCVLFLHLVHLM